MARLTMSAVQLFTVLGIMLMILSALVSPMLGEAYGTPPPPACAGNATCNNVGYNMGQNIGPMCYWNVNTLVCSNSKQWPDICSTTSNTANCGTCNCNPCLIMKDTCLCQ
jgi:hypothetical protein